MKDLCHEEVEKNLCHVEVEKIRHTQFWTGEQSSCSRSILMSFICSSSADIKLQMGEPNILVNVNLGSFEQIYNQHALIIIKFCSGESTRS